MHVAQVTGQASGTVKDAPLTGAKLLACQPVDAAGESNGHQEIVADVVGAGVGDTVLVATGSAARQPAQMRTVPTDATAVMIVDEARVQET